jgi:hypothetical protein
MLEILLAAIFFGLSPALTKATVDQLDDGILHVFLTWHLYALLAGATRA